MDLISCTINWGCTSFFPPLALLWVRKDHVEPSSSHMGTLSPSLAGRVTATIHYIPGKCSWECLRLRASKILPSSCPWREEPTGLLVTAEGDWSNVKWSLDSSVEGYISWSSWKVASPALNLAYSPVPHYWPWISCADHSQHNFVIKSVGLTLLNSMYSAPAAWYRNVTFCNKYIRQKKGWFWVSIAWEAWANFPAKHIFPEH